jgi:acetylornithine deacetylase
MEEKILAAFDEAEMLDLAKSLITIPSFTTEETECARFLADYLGKRGFEAQLMEVDPGRYQTIAWLRGSGRGRALMFNGHIDIDPLVEGWTTDPWTPTIKDGKLYGAGIRNMKGGVAAMIEAALMVQRTGTPLAGDLIIACVDGELQGGIGTATMLQGGVRPDMAVVTEPFGARTIITKHTGWIQFCLHIIGRSQHMGRKDEGVDAIDLMCRVVPALNRMSFTCEPDPDLPRLPMISVGSIVGGRGRHYELRGANLVSDFCSASVDVRFNKSMTEQSVLDDVRRVLEGLRAELPALQYELEYPPKPERRLTRATMLPFDVPIDAAIVQTVRRHVIEVTGREPEAVGAVLPSSYAGDDTAHLWAAGIPCCLYGPGGETTDRRDCCTYIEDMAIVAKVLALTALKVCR